MSDYTAKNLSVLQGLDPVRKRPGMYIGTTSSRGLQHLLWEIADNSVDEFLAGAGSRIDIKLHADGSVEVRDDGRGIPVDKEATTGKSGVVVVFTELHGGGKFGGGAYGSVGGLHGVGASVVNALSSKVTVEVRRDGKVYEIGFENGEPGLYSDKGSFRKAANPKVVGTSDSTGTTVRFWPDRKIFQPDAEFSWDALVERARQTAFLAPGLEVTITDERGEEPVHDEFRFEGGTTDFVEFLSPGEMLTPVVNCVGQGTYAETVPMMNSEGHMVKTDVERTMDVDVALSWGSGYDPTVRSFVNIVATPQGGTHVDGFERVLVKELNQKLRDSKTLKQSDKDIVKADALEGLTAVVLVRIAEPQFEGQTKEILGTPAAKKIVADVVSEGLKSFFGTPKTRQAAKVVMEKVMKAAKVRLSAKAQRENMRRKNALSSAGMPAKLKDCRSHDINKSELFLIEGDSAGGSAGLGRDSKTQALLPLRGKVINTLKASEAKVLKNEEYTALITAMGAGVGAAFDIDQIRYGKLILMADADSDGDHIRVLLLTFLWKYMRPLLDAGRVYAAVPPLFELRPRAKRKRDETVFVYTLAEMQQELSKVPANTYEVKRLKGLGEQNPESLWSSTMNPETRLLRRITANDAEACFKALDMMLGSDAAPRRAYIMEHGGLIPKEEVDA